MLLLTLFLTAAIAPRGHGGHSHRRNRGNNQCTQSDLEVQNSDLACLLQPFTGAVDGCSVDSFSPTTTACSLRLEQSWPHADAVSAEIAFRRLLDGGSGRKNTARIEVTDSVVSGVVLRTGRRRNAEYTCMGSVLTFTSAVMHPYVADNGDDAGEIVALGDADADNEQDSPYADITFTQTNENDVSFDLVARCYVSYGENDDGQCVSRGLKCHQGSYTIHLAAEEEGSTPDENVMDFRMHCRDPTTLEDDQTFPCNWDFDDTCI